jgi:hypothetical protein
VLALLLLLLLLHYRRGDGKVEDVRPVVGRKGVGPPPAKIVVSAGLGVRFACVQRCHRLTLRS